ncbi:MAG TPA: zinc ribbon domain-containing protein [Cyclobacteriaceae bacterium]|nr:zinc ribbon domain-containing protein [Cyclobacteriaceae bacterium]
MKKECPACAMEVDADSKVCPICGYEFTRSYPAPWRWLAAIMVIVIVFLFFYFLYR